MKGPWLAAVFAAALALGVVWFVVATRPPSAAFERERPPVAADYLSYYRPNAQYGFARLAQGEMPLWNASQGIGAPFLATLHTGVLYPPNWLQMAMRPQRAFARLACLHVMLAVVLAGALARGLGAGALGSVAAGLLYGASLPLWRSVFTPPALYAAAWAPGVLLAALRAAAIPGAGRAAVLACAIALQILAGWPRGSVVTLGAAAVVAGVALATGAVRAGRFPLAGIATVAVGAAGGLLLAAPNLLPAIELARLGAPVGAPLGGDPFPLLLAALAIAVAAGLALSLLARRGGRAATAAASLVAIAAVGASGWSAVTWAREAANGFPRERPRPAAGLFRERVEASPLAPQIALAKSDALSSARSYWRASGTEKIGEEEGFRALQDREPLALPATARMLDRLASPDAGPALLDLLSVRLVVTDAPPAWADESLRRVTDVPAAPFAFENPDALPRAWRAARVEVAPADPAAAITRLVDPGFDRRHTVLLDALPPALAEAGAAAPDASAETSIEIDEPELVAIRTRGASPAVVVLNDALYPGWEARLDGEPVPLLRANAALRAVAVPAGEHRVEMRFRPASYRLGLALAGLTAFLFTIAILHERIEAAKPN